MKTVRFQKSEVYTKNNSYYVATFDNFDNKNLSGEYYHAADVRALMEAADPVYKELLAIVEDSGGCDHSVGICWCEAIRGLDKLKAALERIGEVDR